MKILMISLLWILYVKGDVQISVLYGQEHSHQCLQDNDDVILTCTVNPLTDSVAWYHDTTYLITCSNNIDFCVTPGGTTDPRYTSSISDREFTLHLNPVSAAIDAGVYKCQHGESDSDSVTLDACVLVTSAQLQKNGVTINSGSLEVNVSVQTTLTCKVLPSNSKPAPTIVWYIGSLKKQELTSTSYTYTPSATDHDKIIYCEAYNLQTANNAVESAKPKLYVRVPVSTVQMKKDNIAFNDATLTTTAGSTVSLSCTPGFSRPSPPTIDWYIGSVTKLSDSVQYRYTAEANDHNKMIICQAYIPQQAVAAVSNEPRLNINVLVTSVTLKYQGNTPSSGDTVTVTAGSVATFICMTSFSRPQAKIDWYIDGDDTPKQSSTSSTFDLTATEANHNRRIYCKAYNDIQTEPHGVLSEKPMLYVQVSVSFVQLKKDNITFNDATLTVTAGNTVSLSCTPGFSRPSPPTIDWYIGSVLKLSDSVQYRYTAVANDHNKMIYCQAYTPQQAIKAVSNKPWLNVNVEGVRMSIAPSTVILDYLSTEGDGQPTNTFFTCGGITESDVHNIQSIKIYRLTRNDLPGYTGVGSVVATIDAITQNAEIIIDEVKSRATVSGIIDTLDWTKSILVVTFETVQLQCKDEGMYTCEINYETTGSISRSARDSTNLTTNAQPADLSMTALKYGMQTSQFTGTIDNPELVKDGDVLQFKCAGLLGNLPDAKIMWMRTSLNLSSDELTDMNPGVTVNDGSEIASAIKELPEQCSRRQTNYLIYVIQNSDTRKETLAFKCYIEATPPQSATGGIGVKIKVSSTAFYMKIDMGPPATSTEAETNNLAGTIAGGVTAGVLVILVALILIFVYLYRKGFIVKKKNKSVPPEHTYYNTSTKEKVQVFHTEESTSAGQRNEESTYEGLNQDMTQSQAYDALTPENRTNSEVEPSTYTNLTLN